MVLLAVPIFIRYRVTVYKACFFEHRLCFVVPFQIPVVIVRSLKGLELLFSLLVLLNFFNVGLHVFILQPGMLYRGLRLSGLISCISCMFY